VPAAGEAAIAGEAAQRPVTIVFAVVGALLESARPFLADLLNDSSTRPTLASAGSRHPLTTRIRLREGQLHLSGLAQNLR